jgi:GNAT superfamily N-acetyltransferase
MRELAAFERLPGPDDEAAERLATDFARSPPRFELLVAEQAEGAVVGYALYLFTYSTFLARPTLWLEDLYVQPACRGQGTGSALLRALAGIAEERGCGRFEWTVLDWNVGAQALYRRLGATLLDEWRICRLTGPALGALASSS